MFFAGGSHLQTPGCPICNHIVLTARDFFAHWQYALASDEKAQAQFAGELGFRPRCTCGNCTKCRRRGANRSGFLDCSNISRNCWSGTNLVPIHQIIRINSACQGL